MENLEGRFVKDCDRWCLVDYLSVVRLKYSNEESEMGCLD